MSLKGFSSRRDRRSANSTGFRLPQRSTWRRRRPGVEPLETRQLLTGTWQNLNPTNPGSGPSNGLSMMLLSDGTAMIQGGSGSPTTTWYQLSPDSSGNYVTGTWSSLGSMNVARRFFTTAALPDGRIFAVGGEYSTPTGFTNTAEIFDPTSGSGGTWTSVSSVPTPDSSYGDDPIEVLPDGRILAGY
jgi:hypothetical protein